MPCKLKQTIVLLVFAAMILPLFSCCQNKETPLSIPPGINIFVAQNGSDINDGSFSRPFQTLERAQLEVRALKAASSEPVTVNIRGGEYYLDRSLDFSAKDSGSETAPVTWQAYNGEKVLLSGGIKLSSDKFYPVTDEAILSRIHDEKARAGLMSVNLSGYLDEFPFPVFPDSNYEFASGGPEIYIDDEPLTISRFPNNIQNQAFLFADSAKALSEDLYAPVKLTSTDLAERAATWSADAWENMYAVIFMSWDWANGVFDIKSFDAKAGEFVTDGFWGAPQENPRFYVFNIMEEIDVPGESFIDYENKTVYFYAPDNLKKSDIHLSVLKDELIRIDGGEYLTFRGLTVGYTRGDGIAAYNVKHINIDCCTVAHSSRCAVTLDNATDCSVKNCSIYDTVDGSIYLWDGGLRKNLTPSGNIIENNNIRNVNRLRKWTTGSIWCDSTGLIVRNNEIHDEPAVSLLLNGSNDALVEYNEFYRTGLDISDTGAIYYGFDPSILGITIRYNYFHDIGNSYGGIGQQSVFCDDGAVMPYIYGNLFVNASDKSPDLGSAIKANGAQFGVVKNNVFVDSPHAAFFQPWSDWERDPVHQDVWLQTIYDLTDWYEPNMIWPKITENADIFSDTWRDHYRNTQWESLWRYVSQEGYVKAKTLAASGDNEAMSDFLYENAPSQTNLFDGNVCVNIGEMFLENGTKGTNIETGTGIFKDYANGDFSLTPNGIELIRRTIPDFEPLPLSEIGLKTYKAYGKTMLPGGR